MGIVRNRAANNSPEAVMMARKCSISRAFLRVITRTGDANGREEKREQNLGNPEGNDAARFGRSWHRLETSAAPTARGPLPTHWRAPRWCGGETANRGQRILRQTRAAIGRQALSPR